jgi:hemoglobin/transferrin/lactoferrin receptor protein
LIWPAAKANDNSWSAHLSLGYHLTPDWQITINGARSFRSPSLEERFQYVDLGNLVKIGDPHLAPEQGQFFDLGIKWSRPTLWFTLNTFWNELSNLVVDLPAQFEGRPALQKVNVGQARLIGIDGQLDWHLYPTLTLFGSVAYVRGEDRQLDTALPQIPPLNGRVGLRYQFLRLGEINGTLNMFATQNQVATGEFRTPGYTTVDFMFNSRPVSLGYVVQHLVLGVENVLDRAYRNHLASNRGQILVEPGRNWVAKWYLEF